MELGLLLLNLSILRSMEYLLSLAGLLFLLSSALQLGGMKLTPNWSETWKKTRATFSGSRFAWLGAGARMRGLAINCVVALIVFPLGYFFGRHSAQRSNYAKELQAWKQRSTEWQRTYANFLEKHKELTNDSETRRFPAATARTTASTSRSTDEAN